MHRHCCWLFYRFVPLWKQENCPHRITLCGDYRDGLSSREERKSFTGTGTDTTGRFGPRGSSEADTYALGIQADANPNSQPSLLMRSMLRDKIKAARFPNDADEYLILLLWERSVQWGLLS